MKVESISDQKGLGRAQLELQDFRFDDLRAKTLIDVETIQRLSISSISVASVISAHMVRTSAVDVIELEKMTVDEDSASRLFSFEKSSSVALQNCTFNPRYLDEGVTIRGNTSSRVMISGLIFSGIKVGPLRGDLIRCDAELYMKDTVFSLLKNFATIIHLENGGIFDRVQWRDVSNHPNGVISFKNIPGNARLMWHSCVFQGISECKSIVDLTSSKFNLLRVQRLNFTNLVVQNLSTLYVFLFSDPHIEVEMEVFHSLLSDLKLSALTEPLPKLFRAENVSFLRIEQENEASAFSNALLSSSKRVGGLVELKRCQFANTTKILYLESAQAHLEDIIVEDNHLSKQSLMDFRECNVTLVRSRFVNNNMKQLVYLFSSQFDIREILIQHNYCTSDGFSFRGYSQGSFLNVTALDNYAGQSLLNFQDNSITSVNSLVAIRNEGTQGGVALCTDEAHLSISNSTFE